MPSLLHFWTSIPTRDAAFQTGKAWCTQIKPQAEASHLAPSSVYVRCNALGPARALPGTLCLLPGLLGFLHPHFCAALLHCLIVCSLFASSPGCPVLSQRSSHASSQLIYVIHIGLKCAFCMPGTPILPCETWCCTLSGCALKGLDLGNSFSD